MDIVLLLFAVLFTGSAVIVAKLIIKMRKRPRETKEEEQRLKAEEERLKEEAQQKAKEEEQKRLADELQKVDKERKQIEEEARRKAQEKEQRQKAEQEARERAEKEELERLKKEGYKAGQEERKTQEAQKHDEQQLQDQEIEEAQGGKRPAPRDRGGRPRGSITQHGIVKKPETEIRSLRADIVCWKEGWSWAIGAEVVEQFETIRLAQNGEILEQDNAYESRYRLTHAEGTVKASWTGGQKDISLQGAGKNYLIFKMRKNWKEPGRLVRCCTSGYYLIIVPAEWERDEEVSGTAPVEPESVQLGGYKAHFFCQEQNTAIGFITANGERILVESRSPHFQLVEKEIGDASEDMGPLFGEQPPRIQTLDEKGWSGVGVIVVGEEGRGRNRWRTQFVPQVDAEERKLPEEIKNRRGGWYFVRVYDKQDNLLESMDFRFIIGLKDIRMEKFDFLPSPNGYDNVTVQFLHEGHCRVELIDEYKKYALKIHAESRQTIVTVPPKQDCDKTHWILRDGDAKIEVTLLVERIWWAFGPMGAIPTDWVDMPITLSRKEFTATSDKGLWVRFPRPRFVRKIDVGFSVAKRRSYQVGVDKEEIAIPLRDFCDAKEIENRQGEYRILVWAEAQGAKICEAAIAKLQVDRTTSLETQGRKFILPQASVKCWRGVRKGKGFSRKEIIEAGIILRMSRKRRFISDVKRLGIPYDKRRKTSYSWNIKSLKDVLRGNKHVDAGG